MKVMGEVIPGVMVIVLKVLCKSSSTKECIRGLQRYNSVLTFNLHVFTLSIRNYTLFE